MKRAWLKQVNLTVVLAVCVLSTPMAAVAFQDGAAANVDYASVRREIQNFEATVNNAIGSAFNAAPFALYLKTKGVYLQGYGVAFTFMVNIHRALINTPFGQIQREGITQIQKKQRIEELKERLLRVLLENGSSLHLLRKEESVTIVGFFEDRNFPDEENQSKTVILSVLKGDLDEVLHKENRWQEFKQRMKIIEY